VSLLKGSLLAQRAARQTKLLRIRWLYSMRYVGSSIIVRLCTNRVTCRGCGTRPGQVSLAMQHTTKCMRQRCNHGRLSVTAVGGRICYPASKDAEDATFPSLPLW
jgi:hypothetical protein